MRCSSSAVCVRQRRNVRAQCTADCTGTGSPAALQNLMPNLQGGSITIEGTCLGNITLYYRTSFYPGPSGGTIQGQVEVYGTRMLCGSGVVLEGDGTNSVVLWAHDAALLLIQGCPIQNGGNDGIYAERGAIIDFGGPGNSIVNNGNHGIEASDGVTIRLGAIVPNPGGTPDPTQAVTVSGNAADGIHMSGTANLHAYDSSITGNGQNALFLSDASSARFTGGTITAPTSGTMPWAIQVHGASSLRLDSVDESLGGAAAAPNGIILATTNSSVTLYETTLTQNSGSTNPAIQASGAASVTIENANVTGAGNGALSLSANSTATLYGSIISDNGSGSGCGNPKPVINAAGGSTINLAGGNTSETPSTLRAECAECVNPVPGRRHHAVARRGLQQCGRYRRRQRLHQDLQQHGAGRDEGYWLGPGMERPRPHHHRAADLARPARRQQSDDQRRTAVRSGRRRLFQPEQLVGQRVGQ